MMGRFIFETEFSFASHSTRFYFVSDKVSSSVHRQIGNADLIEKEGRKLPPRALLSSQLRLVVRRSQNLLNVRRHPLNAPLILHPGLFVTYAI